MSEQWPIGYGPAAAVVSAPTVAQGELIGTAIRAATSVAQAVRVFRLTIEGEPVAKGRPKLGNIGGHARAFTPAKTRRYEDVVRQRATVEWNGQPLIADTPITLHAAFYRQIPKSWPKREQEAARRGERRPLSKPDASNYAKSIEDGLNGVVYLDDSLLVTTHIEKHYSDRPRVELVLTW